MTCSPSTPNPCLRAKRCTVSTRPQNNSAECLVAHRTRNRGKAAESITNISETAPGNLFVAVAPLAGTRTVSVTQHRTAEDTAQFLWHYCMEAHTSARRIHLILDNLNTHQEAALRRVFGEQKAARFFAHVVFHFTPCHASWLNLAELEINCLKRQGLRRRLPSEEEVKRITEAIVAERNGRYATISWSFTKAKAREKFPALYTEN